MPTSDLFGAKPYERYELPDVIKDRHRHNELIKYASSLLARDCPLSEAKILFKDAWQRCEQPPTARFPITLEEAYSKLKDVYSRYPAGRSEAYQKRSASSQQQGASPQSQPAPTRRRLPTGRRTSGTHAPSWHISSSSLMHA